MNLYSASTNFPQETSLRRRVRRPRRAEVLAARRAALGVLGRGPKRCVRQRRRAGTGAGTSQRDPKSTVENQHFFWGLEWGFNSDMYD